jgi:hypothetical protein
MSPIPTDMTRFTRLRSPRSIAFESRSSIVVEEMEVHENSALQAAERR